MKHTLITNLVGLLLLPAVLLVTAISLDRLSQPSQTRLTGQFWAKAGDQALATGNLELAQALYTQASNTNDPSPEGWLRLGDAYQAQENLEKASLAWEKAGSSLIALEYRLQAHLALHDYEAAVAVLQELLSLQPGEATRMKQLSLLQAATQPEKALLTLAAAAASRPEDMETLLALQQRIQDAIPSAQPAFIYLHSGRGLAALGEWELAAEAFRRATGLRPDYAEAWAFLGEAKQHLNLPPEKDFSTDGLAELETARQLDPSSVSAGLFTALYWRRQGQLSRAAEILTDLAQAHPQEAVIQIEMGNLQVEKSDPKAALGYFIRATELAPEDSSTWLALASFSVSRQYQLPQVGLPAARQLVLLTPDNPTALDLYGQALWLLDDRLNAERFLQRAIQADARYVPARLHLAQVYLESGKFEAARQELNWIVSQAPGSLEAEFAERLIEKNTP